MRYSRQTSNYLKRILPCDLTNMISMTDHVAIGIETLRIDSGCSLDYKYMIIDDGEGCISEFLYTPYLLEYVV